MKNLVHNLTRDIRINLLILITLALGLSVNTTVFSVVNGVLLKPLPFADAERLVLISETKLPEFPMFSAASGNFLDWQKQSVSFESMGALSEKRFSLLEGGAPESLSAALMTASMWSTLRMKPNPGREFSPDEDQEGKSDVVIISHRLWVRKFASDPDILNRKINIDSRSRAVIGVMPPNTGFPNLETDLWMPIAFDTGDRENHGSHTLGIIGRLKDNTSMEEATTDLKRIASQLETAYPDTNQGWSVLLTPVREILLGDIQTALLLLWGAVGFVLLIACANVANLLLARSITRRRDVAIRMALGATRFQITRQMLAESVALAVLGGAVGVLLAYGEVRTFVTLASDALMRPELVRIEPAVLIFTALLSVITGVLFGLMPAMQLSKTDLNESLKEGARGASGGRGRQRIRSALVVAEVSLSLVLLIGAGLVIRSFTKLSQVDPGFNMSNLLTVEITLPAEKYSNPDQRRRFVDSALQEISTLPGVSAAGASHVLPFTGDYVLAVLFEGRPPVKPSEIPSVNYYAVSPDYFAAMGIPLKRGRVFTQQDGAESTRVTVVNETFVSRFYPNEDAIGKRINITQGPETWREIVGIVGDTKQYGLDQKTTAQAYDPLAQVPFPFMTLVVRTTGDPMSLARPIEARIQNVDREQPVTRMRPFQQIVEESIGSSRVMTVLLAAFGGIALLIAATGLYGVMAYSVSQRTREIGLRMALGAERMHVLKLVIGQGMLLTAIGLVLGLAGAFALTRLLQAGLYETSPTDLLTFVGISAILAVVSLLACYVPARRASKVDPVEALRLE